MNLNGGKSKIELQIRLTPREAGRQFGVRSTRLRSGFIRQGISPDSEGKFSLRDIYHALDDLSDLEREAQRARFQAKIDQAEFQRLRLEEKRNTLIPAAVALDRHHDMCVIFFQSIRHSSLSKAEKEQIKELVLEAADRRFPPNGSPASEAAVRRQEKREERRKREEQEEHRRERQTVATSRNGQAK